MIEFIPNPGATLVDSMASDNAVIRAAQVSVVGENDPEEYNEARRAGLINYLMKARHGSPFEHTSFVFLVDAPIFVAREFQRHRIASYNEVSGRYRELEPRFYAPSLDRPVVNEGSGAHPDLTDGTEHQKLRVLKDYIAVSEAAWTSYQMMLDKGIAAEVARGVLPLNLMTQFYVTLNARSLMNFLSLRVDSPDATYTTKPLYEIQQVAENMEDAFSELMPLTYASFVKNGRVAP